MANPYEKYANSYNYLDGARRYNGDPTHDNFFRGHFQLNQEYLANYDPYTKGYAFWIWTKLPRFWEYAAFRPYGQDAKTFYKYFASLTEKNFKSFSGLSNIQLDAEAVTQGFGNEGFDAVTKLTVENREFSINHQEWQGSPLHQCYKYWITGIRDLKTNVATYHGAMVNNPEEMYYSMKNHTGEGYYIVTDPSAGIALMNGVVNAQAIEFAVQYTNIVPTSIPLDHFNYSAGDQGFVEFDQTFKGTMNISQEVTENAAALLSTRDILDSYLGYSGKVNASGDVASISAGR